MAAAVRNGSACSRNRFRDCYRGQKWKSNSHYLARQGRVFEVMAFTYMFATILLVLLESLRPKVRLRKKALPEPDVQLKINGPSKPVYRDLRMRGLERGASRSAWHS